MPYVDVHTHLTHERFAGDCQEVITKAKAAGQRAMVVYGLEPISNRQIMQVAEADSAIVPALGICPMDAVNGMLPGDFPHRVGRFDVDEEIRFIDEQARCGKNAAVSECGLDGH